MINVLLVEDTKMGRDCITGYLRGSDRYRLAALILRRHWNIAFEEPYLTKTIRALIAKYGVEEKETIE